MTQINAFRDDFTNRVNTQFPNPTDRTPDNAQKILNSMLARQVTAKGWDDYDMGWLLGHNAPLPLQ